ncbi:MAG: hypothetical protein C0410_08375 [Anaerolinea sp.]|nr:hypothetical protein [Anaerolinea sp.]
MKEILVFIDGTICDDRKRLPLIGTPDFCTRDQVLQDIPVPLSVDCLQHLSNYYNIIFLGARPTSMQSITEEWLKKNNFPQVAVYLGESLEARVNIVKQLKKGNDFLVGIGDRWDDNELHSLLGCQSIILQEYRGNWGLVFDRIITLHKNLLISQNKVKLEGKVEGLARVCPHLLSKFGEPLWDAYHQSVSQMADSTRESRREEDLSSFKQLNLDPENLNDVARWYQLTSELEWESNPLYGLQDRVIVEASKDYYCHKITHCYYADLWKQHGLPEIGYQIHCRTDAVWWDKPAWNPLVRFEQPKTIMQGDEYCLFIQTLPNIGE